MKAKDGVKLPHLWLVSWSFKDVRAADISVYIGPIQDKWFSRAGAASVVGYASLAEMASDFHV